MNKRVFVYYATPFSIFQSTALPQQILFFLFFRLLVVSKFLNQDIQFVNGVGQKRADVLLSELDVKTVRDMLYVFPYRYIDRSKFYAIRELNSNLPYVQVRAKFTSVQTLGEKFNQRLRAVVTDGTGFLELVWFQSIKWVKDTIKPDKEYIVFGKPNEFNGRLNIVHPEIEELEKYRTQMNSSLSAMYTTTEKMKKFGFTSRTIQTIQRNILENLRNEELVETLTPSITQHYHLPGIKQALTDIHFPDSTECLQRAQFRLKFEELFYTQVKVLKQKLNTKQYSHGHLFSRVGTQFNAFYDRRPFELTGAQKRVIKEIRADMGSGKQMNRLLQGDVGSGKTLVALMCMLIAIDNGYQACMMAPTEILANQHYTTICAFLGDMNVSVRLLTGSTKKKQRDIISEQLKSGELNILVGTHALIENDVAFANVGLCVIDEQHRFGVIQRAKLWQKNIVPPHMLVMTATPIPRTLAMTIYGDLDVSVIDELPPGRKPIKTHHMFDAKRSRLYSFMKEEIAKGRQVYVVYPLIKESEAIDFKNLEEGYESLARVFPRPDYEIAVVHGKLKNEAKDEAMAHFASGKAQIMVATTVIEVGVNVPNASIMVIESAERFGLSQLHQLRGRVGRGAEQSYCILVTDYKISEDTRIRLNAMTSSNDGFEISEIDLKLRGPGDIEGTQQSGMPMTLKIANLAKDGQILALARDVASSILEKDPNLQQPENTIIGNTLCKLYPEGNILRNIS